MGLKNVSRFVETGTKRGYDRIFWWFRLVYKYPRVARSIAFVPQRQDGAMSLRNYLVGLNER